VAWFFESEFYEIPIDPPATSLPMSFGLVQTAKSLANDTGSTTQAKQF